MKVRVTHRRYRAIQNLKNAKKYWIDRNPFHFLCISILLVLINNIIVHPLHEWASHWTSLGICVVQIAVISYSHGQFIKLFFPIKWRRRIHKTKSDLAGTVVVIKNTDENGMMVIVVDWLDRIGKKKSWMDYSISNPMIGFYAFRNENANPTDPGVDDVLLCHIGGKAILFHINEIESVIGVDPYAGEPAGSIAVFKK